MPSVQELRVVASALDTASEESDQRRATLLSDFDVWFQDEMPVETSALKGTAKDAWNANATTDQVKYDCT